MQTSHQQPGASPNDGAAASTDQATPAHVAHAKEWVVLALLLVVLVIFNVYQLMQSRDNLVSEELGRLQNHTRVIEENLVRQLEGANNALAGVRYDLTTADRDSGLQLFPLRLKVLADAMPGVRSVQVLDPRGTIIASSRRDLQGQQLGERPYFKLAREQRDDTALYVSPPFKSLLNVYVVALTRSMTTPEGNFGGVVTVALDPEYFEILLRSVLYAPDMVATMVHSDGLVVVSSPHREASLGLALNTPGSMFTAHMQSNLLSTTHDGHLVSTGERRLVALRTIRPPDLNMDKPLLVSVSRGYTDVLAPWRDEARSRATMLVLLGAIGGVALYFSQRRRHAAARAARRLARAEHESALRFEFGLKGADLGLWDWNLQTDEIVVNEREWQMLGYPRSETPLKSDFWRTLLHPGDSAAIAAAFEAHVRGDTPTYRIEHRMRHHDGHWVWVLDHAMVMQRDAAGAPTRIVGTHLDVSERMQTQLQLQQMNAQLEALSLTDGLTGVGNRRQFDQTLAAEWMRGIRQQQPLALLMIDVDHFKLFNDTHGHQGGDACLQQVAQTLSACLRRPLEQLARYGGEEFAVLLMGADAAGAAAVAQRCLDAVARAKIAHGASPVSPWVSISIGIGSLLPTERGTPEQLLHDADAALYLAKKRGRAQFALAAT